MPSKTEQSTEEAEASSNVQYTWSGASAKYPAVWIQPGCLPVNPIDLICFPLSFLFHVERPQLDSIADSVFVKLVELDKYWDGCRDPSHGDAEKVEAI